MLGHKYIEVCLSPGHSVTFDQNATTGNHKYVNYILFVLPYFSGERVDRY